MKMSDEELKHMKAQIEWVYKQITRVAYGPTQNERMLAALARVIVVGLQNKQPLVPPTIELDRLARWFQREMGTTSDTKLSLPEARKIARRLQEEVVLREQ